MSISLWCRCWHSARNAVTEHRHQCTVQHYNILVASQADLLLGRLLGVSLRVPSRGQIIVDLILMRRPILTFTSD